MGVLGVGWMVNAGSPKRIVARSFIAFFFFYNYVRMRIIVSRYCLHA